MGYLTIFIFALFVVVDEVSSHDCTFFHCDPETGLRKETLLSITYSYEDTSQCADPTHCDDSTPGTGHKLSSEQTDDLIAVERCYSFCYTNVTGGISEGATTLIDNIYAEPACSDTWKQGHVCFSACLFGLESLWTWNEPIASLISDPNTTCSDFCSISGGICDRAFPPDVNSNCLQQCYMETCAQYCRLVEDKFPPQSSADAVTYPSPLQEMPELTMDYTSNVTLKKEGVLEVHVNYVPPPPPSTSTPSTSAPTTHFPLPPGVTLPTVPPTPPPSSLPSGVAYGLIWKVTYGEGGQTRTRYISQHLPFLLLPDEVGPLYRIGSNMLAIRELQCEKNVKVSFAFVNVHGIGPFTTPKPKCFYGSWFPIPTNDVSIKLGFDYSTGELRLEIASSDLSPDHEYVDGYRVQIVYGPSSTSESTCRAKFGNVHTIQHDVAFDSKDNLTLVVRGTQAVEKFFPLFDQSCNYFIGVYALPQRNVSATGRPLFAVANWKSVYVDLPDYAEIRGNTTHTVSTNPITGLSDITFTYTVTSHWSSLAIVKSVYGQLTKELASGDTVVDSLERLFTLSISLLPNTTVHYFRFYKVKPIKESEIYKFKKYYRFRYRVPPFDKFDDPTLPLPPATPSPVRNLTVLVDFDVTKSKIFATLSWVGPGRPYGKIDHYQIVLSSSKTVSLIGSTTLDVKDTSAAVNMTQRLEAYIESYLIEDEYFNFSVRAVSEWNAEGEWAVESVIVELTQPRPMDSEPSVVNLAQYFKKSLLSRGAHSLSLHL